MIDLLNGKPLFVHMDPHADFSTLGLDINTSKSQWSLISA